jgi:hypothetical protein
VREKRLELNLTQDALCARIAAETGGLWNPSEDEVWKIQAGKRIVGDLEIKVLAKALSVSVMWLMGEE